MTPVVEKLSLYIRCDRVHSLYPGGWNQFVQDIPRLRLCENYTHARVDFVMPEDAESYSLIMGLGKLEWFNEQNDTNTPVFDFSNQMSSCECELSEVIDQSINIDKWFFSPTRRCIKTPSNTFIDLTPREYTFVKLLNETPSIPVDRSHLVINIYARDDYYTSRSLDSLVRRLRLKIKQNGFQSIPIKTAHAIGYFWVSYVV